MPEVTDEIEEFTSVNVSAKKKGKVQAVSSGNKMLSAKPKLIEKEDIGKMSS